MILHTLKVTNWRSLLGEHAFGPFSERLNIIHAPNGSGKSSLFEALRRALFDAHSVGGSDIAEIRPWGRDLAPVVEVEFTEAGQRYRVKKRFLTKSSAELHRLEDGEFQPLAEDKQADARIREILLAPDLPGRGVSKQEHWGLAQVLWAPQGQLDVADLSGSVTQALRSALGVQISAGGGSRIERLIADRYHTFFTGKGKLKTGKDGAPLPDLQKQREQLAAELADCQARQQEYEEAVRSVEDARNTREQVRRNAAEVQREITRTRAERDKARALNQQLQVLETEEKLARSGLDTLTERITHIRRLRERLADLGKTETETCSRLEQAQTDQKSAETEQLERRSARDSVRKQREHLDHLRMEAEEARQYVESVTRKKWLENQLREISRIEERLKQAREKHSRLIAPEAKVIRDVRDLLRRQDDARRNLQGALVHLRITPARDLTAQSPGSQDPEILTAGEESVFSDSPEVELRITGVGRVRASGPEVDTEEHRQTLQKLERKLESLTQPFGERDPDKLQDMLDAAMAAKNEVDNARELLDGLLQGRDAEEARAELARLGEQVARLEDKHPDWSETPPSAEDLASQYKRQQDEIHREVEAAETAYDKIQTRLSALRQQVARLEEELRGCRRQIAEDKKRLADLTGDDPSEDDAARESRRQAALKSWSEARDRAEACRNNLAELPPDIEKTVEKLEKQAQSNAAAEDQARDRENQAEARLTLLAEQGVYSRMIETEEQLTALDARIAREELRMNAIRLLHETTRQCRSRMVQEIAGPVERSAGRILERVAGPRLGQLRLDENFVPAGVLPAISAEDTLEPVNLANLSGGEQEQLHLAVRLALGQVLARNARQLVVLDDVLNATDTGRFARILNILEETADSLQIIVLTCHPERYSALTEAELIPLETVARASRT